MPNPTFPKYTTDGEQMTTVTERENDVWVSFGELSTATFYAVLVSKDNADFPHKNLGQDGDRIDITNIYLILDIDAAASGAIKMGIIKRIDGTNADIDYFMNLPYLGGASKELVIQQLNGVNSQLKCSIDSGSLYHGLTNDGETNVAAVNTGASLVSPGGNIAPGLGDVVMKYEHGGGSTNANIFLFYHNTD